MCMERGDEESGTIRSFYILCVHSLRERFF